MACIGARVLAALWLFGRQAHAVDAIPDVSILIQASMRSKPKFGSVTLGHIRSINPIFPTQTADFAAGTWYQFDVGADHVCNGDTGASPPSLPAKISNSTAGGIPYDCVNLCMQVLDCIGFNIDSSNQCNFKTGISICTLIPRSGGFRNYGKQSPTQLMNQPEGWKQFGENTEVPCLGNGSVVVETGSNFATGLLGYCISLCTNEPTCVGFNQIAGRCNFKNGSSICEKGQPPTAGVVVGNYGYTRALRTPTIPANGPGGPTEAISAIGPDEPTQAISASDPSVDPLSAISQGDPHVKNILGESFEVTNLGNHALLQFPKITNKPSLQVMGSVQRIPNWQAAGKCPEAWMRSVSISGVWLDELVGGAVRFWVVDSSDLSEILRFRIDSDHVNTDAPVMVEVPKNITVPRQMWDMEVTKTVTFSLHGLELKVRGMIQKTPRGHARHLDFSARHLERLGRTSDIGGIMGSGDSSFAKALPEDCKGLERNRVFAAIGKYSFKDPARVNGPNVTDVSAFIYHG